MKKWIMIFAMTLASCADNGTENNVQAQVKEFADAVFTNGRVYTVNRPAEWAQALAVRQGKLMAVGSNNEINALVGADTTAVDLAGRMVMPGIHDSHSHPSDAGIQKTLECSFLSNSLSDVLEIIRECHQNLPAGDWLRGGQWNDGLFAESEKTPKALLDEIAPERPVFLMDWSVHNAWVNSAALALLGIDKETPDPNGGVIVRDATTGEATGILLDNAAYQGRRHMPEFALGDRVKALAWALEQMAQHGITTTKEAIVTKANMEAYQALNKAQAQTLNIKTNLSWKSAWANSHEDEKQLIEQRQTFANAKTDTGFVKIMLDGIPPTYTAAMLEPYLPHETFGDTWRGKLMFEPTELEQDVVELDKMGLSVKIHATGDRSARTALNAFEAARKANGDSGQIHEVSHAELIHPDDIPRFAALNVAAEMCPILWYPLPGLTWEAWLGPERQVWPVKDLVDSGALVIYGSDWPVVPTPNPWPGIESMVTRADPNGVSDEKTMA